MDKSFRKTLIRIVTFLGGVYFFFEFLLPKSVLESIPVTADQNLTQIHDDISTGFILIGVMAFGLGLINLFWGHGSRIIFVRKGWAYSLVLLLGLCMMMGVSVAEWFSSLAVTSKVQEVSLYSDFARTILRDEESDTPAEMAYEDRVAILVSESSQKLSSLKDEYSDASAISVPTSQDSYRVADAARKELLLAIETALATVENPLESKQAVRDYASQVSAVSASLGIVLRENARFYVSNRLYRLLYQGLFVALGAAMFSLLGAYIAVAAYRAFRLRSFESSLMMVAAVVVMLGQIPFGIYISEYFPEMRLWLMKYPNSAAFRAIAIGASVAGLIMAFRMWFSIESESFDESKPGGKA